jgi:hypothetical protein
MVLDIYGQIVIGALLLSLSGLLAYLFLMVLALRKACAELSRRTVELAKFDHAQFEMVSSLRGGIRAVFMKVGGDIGILAREAGPLEEINVEDRGWKN